MKKYISTSHLPWKYFGWIKTGIVFVCVIAVAITVNSCIKRCTVYYACCKTNHAPWKGRENVSCQGEKAETRRLEASMEAEDHDRNIHNGVRTATVCIEYK
jgi:ribosomal protein L31